MKMDLHEIRNTFRSGDCAVYPLILEGSNHPDAGRIKVVSARKVGTKWVEVDHYGDWPLQDWSDVILYMEDEISRLTKLVALAHVSPKQAKEYWREINPNAEVTGIPNQDSPDNLKVSDEGVGEIFEHKAIDADSPRHTPQHWEPVLEAWQFTLNKLTTDHAKGGLV